MSDYAAIEKEARIFTEECVTNNRIDPTLFAQYDIKRGLRDKNGKGVLAGITNISRIDAFEERDGQKVPCEGKLWYRGYNVYDLIRGLRGKRYAFEGAAYLLLLGDLPNKEQLESFTACLAKCRDLPTNFVRLPVYSCANGSKICFWNSSVIPIPVSRQINSIVVIPGCSDGISMQLR